MAYSRLPLKLILSYVLDWIVVIIIAAVGGVLNYISGYHRPFSLTDLEISYPSLPDIVTLPVLVLVSFAAPGLIIIILCLLSRLLGIESHSPHRRVWLQTLWEIHAGVIGLCASLACTLFIVSGLKDMIGKPRPNLLARCDADLSRISGFVVGGFGTSIDSETSSLVTSGICRQTDRHLLDDSFSAFPSGHSSFSSAGLVYLTLWLCARFSLRIPYLSPIESPIRSASIKQSNATGANQSAPPLWQFAAALTPAVVALFICATRYADFHHAGFDIIGGAIIGTFFALGSFHLYHLPIRRSRGILAWRERSNSHAFFSSPAQFDDQQSHDTGAGFSSGAMAEEEEGGYELRDTESGRPIRVDTYGSSRPIVSR